MTSHDDLITRAEARLATDFWREEHPYDANMIRDLTAALKECRDPDVEKILYLDLAMERIYNEKRKPNTLTWRELGSIPRAKKLVEWFDSADFNRSTKADEALLREALRALNQILFVDEPTDRKDAFLVADKIKERLNG